MLERGHVLMLGWTASSIMIIEQLALAGESEGGTAIVVLAEKSKAEMERELESAVAAGSVRLRGSQVVWVDVGLCVGLWVWVCMDGCVDGCVYGWMCVRVCVCVSVCVIE